MIGITKLGVMDMNPAIAYAVGLAGLLSKMVEFEGEKYIVGSVNHNSNMVTDEDLLAHWRSVFQFFNDFMDSENQFQVMANMGISPKKGFSILISCDGQSDEKCIEILKQLINKIAVSDINVQTAFVRGCFDGRSSYDTTLKFLSVDVDRDYDKQESVKKILKSLGIDVNLNQRAANHKKNDQIRIKPECINRFLENVGMFSVSRKKLIKHYVKDWRK